MDIASNGNARPWQLDKTISITHVLSSLVIAVSVFTYISSVDRGVQRNAQDIKYTNQQLDGQQRQLELLRNEFRQDNATTQAKLDRLIERVAGK